MIATGKCPKCDKIVSSLRLNNVDATVGLGSPSWNAVTYNCPWCSTVLGAGIDPVALKTDTVNQLLKALKGAK